MAAGSTSSDIVPLNSMEIETAWHLLTVLIRQGSPTRLAELALRSALAPDLVEILCRILGSRLKFTSGGFISFSNEAVESFGEFMMRAVAWYVPRDVFRVSGMRRGRWNVSLTYVRKRKARSLGNAGVLLSSSKRRTVLTLERGEGEPMKVEGLPKILSYLNKIPGKVNFDVASPSGNDWHSVGMDAFDYSAVGLDQAYNLPISIHGLSCFESRNISNTKEEDTRASDPYITTSVFPHNKAVDFSCEHIPLDVGLDANIIKEEALQRLMLVEPDFRPLLDQSSVVNQTLGEECNTLSLELGFVAGIPEVHFPERLNAIELDFETSLIDQAPDQTTLHQLDHNTQSASSPLACSNQLVVEAIDERKWHSKDDKLITGQLETKETLVDSRPTYLHRKETSMFTYEFGDVDKNSAAIEDKQRTLSEPSIKDHIASVGLQNLIGPNIASNGISSTKQQDRNVEGGLIVKQKVKSVCNVNVPSKENRVDAFAKATKNSSEQKLMPNFESFIIEEEEGSGGYGTVYKAQRKEDGKIFAVKCPHANAHSHHVYNELKMLERFGGRNFVIKYECSFKNGDSECFVLEHVEHDRPEILKKEIGMFELQWYGFCMFRALASLHKQGVVHRDVKPGNFLFSRKVNKGYLIDFNLASDLQQKFCRSSKFYCVFPFFSSATMRPLVRVYVYCLLLSLNL